jgi:CheY-like chemotaxis protein
VDKGIGYDESLKQQDPNSEGGFGLFNLRERLSLVRGTLEIQSKRGGGTRVILSVPLQKASLSPKSSAISHLLRRPFKVTRKGEDSKIKVLIADDHQMMREGLRKVLEAQNDIQVVGEASDGEMAVELARTRRPDVVLMDINMPKMDGIEATRRIAARKRDAIVIGLSIQEDKDVKRALIRAGGRAYLTKREAAEALCATIRRYANSNS